MDSLQLERLSPALGARVKDFDAGQVPDPQVVAALEQALAEHGVLVFRDQRLTPQAQVDFSRCFGPLEPHVFENARLEGHPEIYVLSNRVEAGKAAGRSYAGLYWHSDMSYRPLPAMGSLLYALEIPRIGGDTLFVNMEQVYESLSAGLQELLVGLRAVHDFSHADRVFFARREDGGRLSARHRAQTPPAEHPVVRTHPLSGRRSLFVNPGFTSRFVGMTEEESAPILDMLYQRATDPAFSYRHQWRRGDLVFWDNRSGMHRGVGDYQGRRHMHRTTVRGDEPRLI